MSSQPSPATHPSGSSSTVGGTGAPQARLLVSGTKRGRLPNLARFDRERGVELTTPIDPLSYCRLNDSEWYMRLQQVVLDLRNGIVRQYPGVTPAMVAHVDGVIAKMEKLPIGRQFVPGLTTKRRYPDLQISGVRRERAIEISEALLDVTRWNPPLVRYGVLGYLYAVDDRMRVTLLDHAYAPFGRAFIKVVDQVIKKLDSPWLCRTLEGVEVDGARKDPTPWLHELGLKHPKPIDIPFGKPITPGNRAELDHIRVDVCLAHGQNRQSREFFEVMMLAGLTELWKCVTP